MAKIKVKNILGKGVERMGMFVWLHGLVYVGDGTATVVAVKWDDDVDEMGRCNAYMLTFQKNDMLGYPSGVEIIGKTIAYKNMYAHGIIN